MRNVSDKSCGEYQNTHFLFRHFFSLENRVVYEIMRKKFFLEPGRPSVTIWRMRIACWIPTDTKTHSEYVILIALPLQYWLHDEGASVLCCSTLPVLLNYSGHTQAIVFFFLPTMSS